MALGNIVRQIVNDVKDMTEGFDRVFGQPPRMSGVTRQRARERAAQTRPRRKQQRPAFQNERDIDLSFGMKDGNKKLFDRDKKRRLY